MNLGTAFLLRYCDFRHYRKRYAVTLSAAKGPGIPIVRRDASLRSA